MIGPATAGPMKRARLKIIEAMAIAAGRSGRSTSAGISARRTGCQNEETTPSATVKASSV